MISDHRIERYTGTDDLLLIHVEDLDPVPTDVSERQSDGHAAEILRCLAKVSHRLARKLREMLVAVCLRIGDCNDIIVIASSCPLQCEVKLAYAWCRFVKGRHAGLPVSDIT